MGVWITGEQLICQHSNFKRLPLNHNTFHINLAYFFTNCLVKYFGKFGDERRYGTVKLKLNFFFLLNAEGQIV
jgi:hypothetical protein